jgi:hypothetical protein
MNALSRSKDGWVGASFKAARSLGVLLALHGCVVFLGPHDRDETRRDLIRARAQWNVNGVSDYEVIARTLCFCGYGGERARVVVRNGQVTSVVLLSTGRVLSPQESVSYRPIDQLFDMIEAADRAGAHRIEARYDAHYGYPTYFFIDYSVNAADEEFGYEILSFTEG